MFVRQAILKIKEFSMNSIENDKKAMLFSRVDTENTVVIPEYKETLPGNDSQFVKYGPLNTYPNDLRQLCKESVTASSVINGVCEYMKGVKYEYNIDSKNITPESINTLGDTMDELIESCVRDQVTFGGFAIQVIYNKLGEIAELYNIPLEFLRTNESRDRFWFSKKWSRYSTKSIEYPAFDKSQTDVLVPSEIFYRTNSGRLQTYPISFFTPVLYDMLSESVSGKYIAKTLESGISARYVISLPNAQNLTDQQKQDIEDGIKAKFTGIENAGEFLLYFNNGDQGLEVEKIDNDDSGDAFNAISDAASLRIYKSMHATPALFGDPSQSSGFNSNEYEEALKVFKRMTLVPLARTIEKGLCQVLGDNAVKITVE